MLRNRNILFLYLASSTIVLSLIGCVDRRVDQTMTITKQNEEILNQNNAIDSQNKAIADQKKKIIDIILTVPPPPASGKNEEKAETLRQIAELCSGIFDADIIDYLKMESNLYDVAVSELSFNEKEEIKNKVRHECEDEHGKLKSLEQPVKEAVKAVEAKLDTTIEKIKQEIPRGYSFSELADPVYFDFGSWLVKKELDKKRLELLAKTIVETKAPLILLLQGHTDPIGTEELNQRLSEKRANSVKSILIDFGLPEKNIRVEGYGESELIVPRAGGSERGAEKNRRVVFGINYF